MSIERALSRLSVPFDKNHDITNVNQLERMKPEEIIFLHPKKIRRDICTHYCEKNTRLNTDQKKAIKFVLELKEKLKKGELKNEDVEGNQNDFFNSYRLGKQQKTHISHDFDEFEAETAAAAAAGGKRRKRKNRQTKRKNRQTKRKNKKTKTKRH
jgi:hypothetical protein